MAARSRARLYVTRAEIELALQALDRLDAARTPDAAERREKLVAKLQRGMAASKGERAR